VIGDPAATSRALELARLRAMLRRLPTRSAAPRPSLAPSALRLESVDTPHGVALRRMEEVVLPAPCVPPDADGTVYLDTETTGLAGGTGTYVFLVGLGRWQAGRLAVTQYFLGDLAAEPAFLAAVRTALAEARQIVTFNGRSFDFPLLETRYLLTRAPWWGADIPHVDLYPLARALWRAHAADCRLTTLEAALLELNRGDDVPGALMPQLYFRYLRHQDTRALPRLFRHNRWDVVALALLAARADALLAGPDPRHDPREWIGAARWLERRDPGRSVGFYEAALDADRLPRAQRTWVAWRLGRLWRRAGRAGEALALWRTAVAADPGAPIGLLVDLAKLCEHHARDYQAARRLTETALARAEHEVGAEVRPIVLGALGHRARRLARRLAGMSG
jgi:uncharacterized protein YprB with RNaseH-like and TPR domain